MGACGFLAGRVCYKGCQVGGDGGTDVLTHDERHSHIEAYPSVVAHDQRDSHHGRRGLYEACENGSYGHEEEYGQEAVVAQGAKGIQEPRVLVKVGQRPLQQFHAHQQQGKAYHRLAYGLHPVAAGKD